MTAPKSHPLAPDSIALGEALRDLIEAINTRAIPAQQVTEILRQVSALRAQLPEETAKRWYHFGGKIRRELLDEFITTFTLTSPARGLANPLAPPMHVEVAREGARECCIARFRLGASYEGPPGHAHGGVVALLFDDLLGQAQILGGRQGGMTGELTTTYRKPTPLHRELIMRGWIESESEGRIWTRGECHDGDTLTAEARGLFIRTDTLKRLQEQVEGPGSQ